MHANIWQLESYVILKISLQLPGQILNFQDLGETLKLAQTNNGRILQEIEGGSFEKTVCYNLNYKMGYYKLLQECP